VLKISIAKQTIELAGKIYQVSTAKAGVSFVKGSGGTPTGKLIIADKIGQDEPVGTIFESRLPVGLWDGTESSEDLILTRILTLDGCEPANENTLQRYIYIHGTNQESMLGTPASCGCIRMSNADIIELFELVEIGEIVFIKEDDE
jgi:lipoprotein-anchoring transpeptidase ErfK/SrfK